MCDIVLLVYDQLEYTKACIESILNNTLDYPYRLIIVDNGSVKKETRDYLSKIQKENQGQIKISRLEPNQGYVKAVNAGLKDTTGEFVCVISNDTIVYPGWLSQMVKVANIDKLIGIVNPLWEIPKKVISHKTQVTGKIAQKYFNEFITKQKDTYIETDWARGFCYLTKREVINKIGGLDLEYSPGYYDDWDYSMRALKEGYICVRAKGAFVWHYKNVTYGTELGKQGLNKILEDKGVIFYGRWAQPLKILQIIDPSLKPRIIFLKEFNLKLLRQQNKLTVITDQKGLEYSHTNYWLKKISGFLLIPKILAVFINDLRHNKHKRFDFIVCSGKINNFLQKVPFIRNNYNIEVIDDNFIVEKGLEQIKKYRKFTCN